MPRPPRRLHALRGLRDDTRRRAVACLAGLAPDQVLWVSAADAAEGLPFAPLTPSALRKQLGRSAAAVVLDAHDGLHADVLAASHGFLPAGGTLLLRLPPDPVAPAHLRVHPSRCIPAPPTTHFEARLRRMLPAASEELAAPAVLPTAGTEEQRDLVSRLAQAGLAEEPSLHAVIARRGRGKSTALGRALNAIRTAGQRVALCAPDPAAAAVARAEAGDVPCLDPRDALDDGPEWDVLAVDEAARLPVPWLLALAARHRGTLLFATTTGGYEGTGQGFVLRFLASLEADGRPLARHHLHEPIRWAPGDPLEAWIDRLLFEGPTPSPQQGTGRLTFEAVPRADLADDDALLGDAYALLQHAHYRTTPADLQRLLDAPNLYLHVARRGAALVAVNLVAVEGGLTDAEAHALRDGALRIRGHALPDTLVAHMGALDAAAGCWVRSVRLAVHPDHRGQGIASGLIGHVHAHHLRADAPHGSVDGFGTLFGAVPHVVRLRRRLGYRLVRLGAARGSRTGEPSAVMVRPVAPWTHDLVDRLAGRTARDLDLLMELLHGDGQLPLSTALVEALREGLPPAATLEIGEVVEAVQAYVHGPRPLEASAAALRHWLSTTERADWTAAEERILQDRLFDARSWRVTAQRSGHPHPRAAMRALKRACRRLPLPVGPHEAG